MLLEIIKVIINVVECVIFIIGRSEIIVEKNIKEGLLKYWCLGIVVLLVVVLGVVFWLLKLSILEMVEEL